ncbi:thiol peroxidase [Peptoniphilus sp. KCTC 25270]|uniref:thiol peroxidase n=1 Tax=Peptoniphilus sp. KCTC 25270 TaxID=2897414 RepID=UPI001E597AD3|nr:thiol peroxidase [Peptoniphilus sp. KCTC 25270]MCD1147737.1 thiol peroxidase [Peptoniphilus sp. KCTC 25270]
MNGITFGGDPITVVGEEIKVGAKAPEFKALKNDLSVFDSADLNGKVRIFSVVPSVDTGVCAIQTKNFNEMATELGENVHIVTISNDLPFAQARFGAAEGIENAEIVSDHKDLDFGKKYGFLIEELRLLTRGIVIVGKDDEVKYVEYVKEVTDHPDYDKALEEAKKLV